MKGIRLYELLFMQDWPTLMQFLWRVDKKIIGLDDGLKKKG